MAISVKTLTWNDRLALLNHFKPSDDEACRILGVTQGELNTARNLEGSMFQVTQNLDYSAYLSVFANGNEKSHPTSFVRPGGKADTLAPPATASKPTRAAKKRGRQGNKIATAFSSIPHEATPVEAYALQHGVSLNALRQSSRFDKSPELGRVRVKKDKETNTLMIWRDQP